MAYLLTLNLIFMFVPFKKSYDKPESESRLVVPDSLKPHGLYSLWNSPGQNTGVIPFSRGSSQPRNRTQVSHIADRFFTSCATRETHDKPRKCTKKQRHHFVYKGLYSQSYGFSNVLVWELNHTEDWVLKNWCFWNVVLGKTFENALDCKEVQPVNPKGNQLWIFIGRTEAEAETPIFWPPDSKNWLMFQRPWC